MHFHLAARTASFLLLAGLAWPCPADVVLPSSALSTGANAAVFQTNVRLFNTGPSAAVVVPILYDQATGETVTRPSVTIPSRQQVRYDNVLSSLFGRSAPSFGPIRLQTSSTTLVVSSSVDNVNACGSGAVSGQWLPGIDTSQALTAGVLVQLAASASSASGYRTNVVFFNPGTATATISAKVRKGDGTILSTAALPSLPPNGFLQKRLDDAATFPGVAGTTDTSLWLEFTADQPVLSFASIIHNVSGDPFAVVAVRDGSGSCPPGFSGPDCTFCTWTTAGAACQPRSPRDLLDLAAIKALTLADLGWTLKETQKLTGVTVYVGDWSGGVFPAYDTQGKPVDLNLREAAAVYVPDGYPATAHPDLGLVSAAHYADKVDSSVAASIARQFGMPVLYHGEYPNWRDAGYSQREDISQASGPNLYRANPCFPSDLVRGYFYLALAQTDMRAITLLQRLAELAGGRVRKVALRGFSKEGAGAWLAFDMDDRIEVGIPGGVHGEDSVGATRFIIAATGCEAGSPSQQDIQAQADSLSWRLNTPAGAAIRNQYSVAQNLPLLYPRMLLIDGDVCMYNMHDGVYGAQAGDESAFLDGLTGRPWRYVRKATLQQGADGEDGDVTSTTAVPKLGAELLVSGPGSEAALYPDILTASATLAADSFVVSAMASAPTQVARVWWTWSTDRILSEQGQEPWKSVPMTAAGGGVWTSPPIAVPPGTVIAWYAEVGNSTTVDGVELNRTHAAPIRILRPTPDRQCPPTVTHCN